MEDLDLNIDNYELTDILGLFRLDFNFNERQLKQAYKMTLMTHPDKSGMDKEVFLFFSKAFKILKQIYDHRRSVSANKRRSECSYMKRDEYNSVLTEFNDDNHTNDKEDAIKKIMERSDFNKWFNKNFENVKIHDEEQDNGYDEWFASDEGLDTSQISNVTQMNEAFHQRKSEARTQALSVHKDVDTMESAYNIGNSSLAREAPESYGSSIFSKLQYEDLKKAHTETVVPVTEADFHSRRHFSSTDELNIYRKQTEQPLSKTETNSLYKQQQEQFMKQNTYRSYKLIKQQEQITDAHNKWWGSILQLKNN